MAANPFSAQTLAFARKTVFITGGTGFFGKALIEKLLRSAPSIEAVRTISDPETFHAWADGVLYTFVLIRPRKDASATKRLDNEIINSPIFDRLRRELGSSEVAEAFLRSKLRAVAGDVTSPPLV